MALNKKIINSKGIEINYIKISSIIQQFSDKGDILVVNLVAYKDETYRNLEKSALKTQTIDEGRYIEVLSYRLPIDDIKGYDRESIYNRLKIEIPQLAQATNI